MEKNMIGVQPLLDVVGLTLQTAFVADENDGYRPSSLLLIARPESGKSTTIMKFRKLDFVRFLNEITVKTLIDHVFPHIESGLIKTLLIPDILNCIEKSTYTRQPLVNTLKSLVDEGVSEILTPHKRYNYPLGDIKAGLISAITRISLYAMQGRYSIYADLKRMGFMSRMVPFSYKYPINKVLNIFKYIEGNIKPNDKVTVVPEIIVRDEAVIFNPDPKLFSDLRVISMKLGELSDAYGIRCQKNLQKMCYASALMDGREFVKQKDIDKILELSKWMNFDFNPL